MNDTIINNFAAGGYTSMELYNQLTDTDLQHLGVEKGFLLKWRVFYPNPEKVFIFFSVADVLEDRVHFFFPDMISPKKYSSQTKV